MGTVISHGSIGPDVARWQAILNAGEKPTTWTNSKGIRREWAEEWEWPLPTTGNFYERTHLATEAWQFRHKLTADGIVGPKTWMAAGYPSLITPAASQAPAATDSALAMKFVQAKHYYKGGNKPKLIVIHDMEYPERPTGAEWCADFFAAANAPQASAHFCVDSNSIVQCVNESDGAWHCPGSLPKKGGLEINRSSIGIEHAGYARQTKEEWADTYSMAELELSAKLVADICRRYDIPAKRLTPEDLLKEGATGICGHVDCTKATGVGSHWDPGSNFPFDWYIDRVNAALNIVIEHPPDTLPAPEPKSSLTPSGWITAEGGLNFDAFVEVECKGVLWLVAPIYVAPVGIGEADEIAHKAGCELPSPELVDAIYAAADCKLDAQQIVNAAVGHDGTPKTMDSPETHAKVAKRLAELVQEHGDFKLLAGPFKDVVRYKDKLGIYGWFKANGVPIQGRGLDGGIQTGHALSWSDYSQALRYCKRKFT